MKKIYYVLLLLTSLQLQVFAQSDPALERIVSVSAQQQSVQQILNTMQQQTGLVFSFAANNIDAERKTSLSIQQKSLRQALHRLFGNTVTYKVRGNYIILQKQASEAKTELIRKPKKTIEGYINSPETGKPLANASVYSSDFNTYTVSDQYGYFKLDIDDSKPLEPIKISKVGYCDAELSRAAVDSGFIEAQLHNTCAVPLRGSDSLQNRSTLLSSFILPKEKINFLRNISDTVFTAIQISVLPFVGTNALLSGNATNATSINVTVGYVKEIKGLELGAILNIVKENVDGCDVAGVGSIIGEDCRGAQLGGVFCVADMVDGIQAAGTISVADSVHGMQLSGTVGVSRAVAGTQLSGTVGAAHRVDGAMVAGVVCGAHSVHGIVMSGVANGVKELDGTSIAGVVGVNTRAHGTAISGVVNVADTMQGVQIAGVVNKARYSKGLQFTSLLNITGELHGVQLSVINIADSCRGAQIGIFNYVRKGYHYFELSGDETFYANLAYRTGMPYVHSIFQFSMRPQTFTPLVWAVGYGLGTTIGKRKVRFEVDVTAHSVCKGETTNGNALLRGYTGIDLGNPKGKTLSLGVTYNFFASNDFLSIAPSYAQSASVSNGAAHQKWIGAKLALRW